MNRSFPTLRASGLYGDGFVGGTKAAQQRVDAECNDAQHGDFPKGIEGPEIHQDHVDNVRPTSQGHGLLHKKAGYAVWRWPGHHDVGEQGEAPATRSEEHTSKLQSLMRNSYA